MKAGFESSSKRQIQIEGAEVSQDLFYRMRAMMDELAQASREGRCSIRADVQLPQAADQMTILIQLKSELECIQVDDNLLQDTAEETTDVRKIALAGSGSRFLELSLRRFPLFCGSTSRAEYFWGPASFWSRSD